MGSFALRRRHASNGSHVEQAECAERQLDIANYSQLKKYCTVTSSRLSKSQFNIDTIVRIRPTGHSMDEYKQSWNRVTGHRVTGSVIMVNT